MKKNILLTLVLSGLILFAYLWEQKGFKKEFEDSDSGTQIFNVDSKNLAGLTLKNSKILLKEGKWIVGELNYPADQKKIKFIITTLSGITSVSRIPKKAKTKDFFVHQDHSFRVKTFNGEVGFRLGDISPVTGYFYIEKFENGHKELFLAKDTNAYDGIYKDDIEAEFRKYLAFKNIITMNPMELISEELIPGFNIIDLIKITLDNKLNRWFEVDFLQEKTIPPPYKGLKIKPAYKKMEELWSKVKVKKIIPLGKNVLSKELSKVELLSKYNKYKLTLYGKFNGATGYFVVLEGQDKIFVIEEQSKDFFFSNVQDFWDKKIDYNTDFSKIKSFKFKLGSKEKRYQFKVSDIDHFKVEVDDSRLLRVKEYNINLLFNLVLNLVKFKEAKYVSDELSKVNKDEVSLYMDLFNIDLRIVFKQNSITVQDLTHKLEYFYPHKISSINVKGLSDFFTLK